MAKFHFVSDWGDTLFLALRLQQEGHAVSFQCRESDARHVGEGLVRRALSPESGAVVIFDSTGRGALGKRFREMGHPVIGGNPFDVELEEDRTKGAKIMTAAGIAIPKTETFKTLKDAHAFLDSAKPGGWFFKPSGHGADTALTHSADDPKELQRFLVWAEDHIDSGIKSFEIQRAVKGTEISTNGWFDGTKFVPPFDGTIEDKKLMTGDLGPRTGCQSNVVWFWPDNSMLPTLTVERITQQLKRHKYVGPIDLNAMISGDGTIYGLEWTARMGFDATQAWMLLLATGASNVGDQLDAFARGDLARWHTKHGQMALTLRVSMPPYPQSEGAIESVGMPLGKDLLKNEAFLPYYVMGGSDGPACAGVDGSVGVVGAVGTDITALRERVLDHAHSLDVPSAQFRTDPVKRAERVWKRLTDLGYMRKALG